MPIKETIPNHDKDLHRLAVSYALELGNKKSSVAKRGLAAQRLRPLISTILLPDARTARQDWRECLRSIIGKITEATLALLDLGEGYRFADVKVKLDIAYGLMGAFDELACSDAIAIEEKVPIIDAAETLIEPALRTVARLTDPDRVEYVCDVAIGLGHSAMLIALRASWIVRDKGRELRQSRITVQ